MKLSGIDSIFWRDKKVFITGHTGFKGSWLSLWLASMGARVQGYALAPITSPNLFNILEINSFIEKSYIADIRDLDALQKAILDANPDIVIHMAAQPLVRYSYSNPVETYSVNAMGTVHILESMRTLDSVRATVVVTSDKCYENKEWIWAYRENDSMGGYDPYSSSKGCAELITAAYRQSFFNDPNAINKIATARAGNVIGGGDWSEDRLIPDAIRAFEAGKKLIIRNPMAVRPWQHVLEPLSGYLMLAKALYENGSAFDSSWNFGPRDEDNRTVQDVVDLFVSGWRKTARWGRGEEIQPHEARLLKLDCSKARSKLGWIPKWGLEESVRKIIAWQRAFKENHNMKEVTLKQIDEYQN
jgi:CDP-glucose 4,6-dehydratase